MTPSERTMPLLVANREGRRWSVALPGGRTVFSGSKGELEAIVAREVPFTSLRFADPAWLPAAAAAIQRSILDASDPEACHYSRWKADPNGYVSIRFRHQTKRAHRVLYEVLVGPIPEGLVLDHICDHPTCLNVRHLRPVTQRENILRSSGMAAVHAKQTACVRGHAFTAANTRLDQGKRACRACDRARKSRRPDPDPTGAARFVPGPGARMFGGGGPGRRRAPATGAG